MPKQILSAAVDNAATRIEWEDLLDEVARNPALKKSWSHIWEWRAARDGIAVTKGSCEFAAGVMAAIHASEQAPAASNVLALPLSRSEPVPRARTWKTWVPVSAAAGALAAALMFGTGKPVAGTASLTVASQALPGVAMVPVSARAQHWVAGDAQTGTAPDAATAALLDSYLVEHSSHEVAGTLAGARFAVQTASFQTGE